MPAEPPPPPRRNWHLARWFLVLLLAANFCWSGWQTYAYRSAVAQAYALGWKVEYSDPIGTNRKDWQETLDKETWPTGTRYLTIPTSESFEQHIAIAQRLNPEVLYIEKAPTLRDLSLLKRFARLRTLSLYEATGLTNLDALENLTALQDVSLDGFTDLKNGDVLKKLPSLQKVSLTRCRLTNVEVLKNLSFLQSLNLSGCTGLTNVEALKTISALNRVWLNGCTGLTNVDGLKNLPALRLLDLTGCTGLMPESVAALKAALPNTKVTGP